MNKEEQSTKERIIEVADQLFAKKGFDGTSVREIAKLAQVNIGAINYHFNSKERLYWSVTLRAHLWLEDGIKKVSVGAKNTFDLSWKIYEFLHNDSSKLRNAFIMMISDTTPEIDEEYKKLLNRDQLGPPGGQYIFDIVTKELGEKTSQAGRLWAVKSIFTYLVHWVLMTSTTHCKEIFSTHPYFQLEVQKRSLKNLVQASLEFVKNHPDDWPEYSYPISK